PVSGMSPGFIGPALSAHLARFDISACFISSQDPNTWHMVFETARPFDRRHFELRYGKERARYHYNRESLARAAETRTPFFGVHGGYSDLFVPIVEKESGAGFVACGPFRESALTGEELANQWETLTGRPPSEGDTEYATYVRAMLDTPLIDAPARKVLV